MTKFKSKRNQLDGSIRKARSTSITLGMGEPCNSSVEKDDDPLLLLSLFVTIGGSVRSKNGSDVWQQWYRQHNILNGFHSMQHRTGQDGLEVRERCVGSDMVKRRASILFVSPGSLNTGEKVQLSLRDTRRTKMGLQPKSSRFVEACATKCDTPVPQLQRWKRFVKVVILPQLDARCHNRMRVVTFQPLRVVPFLGCPFRPTTKREGNCSKPISFTTSDRSCRSKFKFVHEHAREVFTNNINGLGVKLQAKIRGRRLRSFCTITFSHPSPTIHILSSCSCSFLEAFCKCHL
jgi:hypothetical protein